MPNRLAGSAIILMSLCASVAGAAEGSSPDELKRLVKEHLRQTKPTLNPSTELSVEEIPIEGLKALKVQIVHVGFVVGGKQFNTGLFMCHDGKLTPFAETFGGHGLMSGVVSDGRLFYTYSWGSGRHRSHLGQVALVDGKPVVTESGAYLDKDFFVKKDGNAVQLEEGTFEKFNVWKSGEALGAVKPAEAGFSVLNSAGKEDERFRSKASK